MNVLFLRSFSKDLDKIADPKVKKKILKIIELAKSASGIKELNGIKKLAGYGNAYRLRLGDYRLGLFYQNEELTFARLVHRKDIYKVFP